MAEMNSLKNTNMIAYHHAIETNKLISDMIRKRWDNKSFIMCNGGYKPSIKERSMRLIRGTIDAIWEMDKGIRSIYISAAKNFVKTLNGIWKEARTIFNAINVTWQDVGVCLGVLSMFCIFIGVCVVFDYFLFFLKL